MNKIGPLLNQLATAAKPQLKIFWKYAQVELVPPNPMELPQVLTGIGNIVKRASTGSWKELTVKEATLNTLVGIEVACWFYVGEVIGKRHLVGYDV